MKRGLCIGKFMPLHLGHEFMIEMAAAEVDELVLLISEEPHELNAPSLDTRYTLLKNKYAGRNITVVKFDDEYGPPEGGYDSDGTAIDPAFWAYWIMAFKKLGKFTHVFSSDVYGKEIARRLTAKWCPIDPKREVIPITATEIRNDHRKNWKYISKEFRNFYVTKIAVLGAESSGKSTFCRDLAATIKASYVPEYGRILVESIGQDLSKEDFIDIMNRHHNMGQLITQNSEHSAVIYDTEKVITWLYGKEYLNKDVHEIYKPIDPNEFDYWVLIPPNIPWVQDGARLHEDQEKRDKFYASIKEVLVTKEVDPVRIIEITETNRIKRIVQFGEIGLQRLGNVL